MGKAAGMGYMEEDKADKAADTEVDMTEDMDYKEEGTEEDTVVDRGEDMAGKVVPVAVEAPVGTADTVGRGDKAGKEDMEGRADRADMATAAVAVAEEVEEAAGVAADRVGKASCRAHMACSRVRHSGDMDLVLGDRGDPTSCRYKVGGGNGSNGRDLYEKIRSSRVSPANRSYPGGNTKLDFAWNRILSSFASGTAWYGCCPVPLYSLLAGVCKLCQGAVGTIVPDRPCKSPDG